MKKKEPRFMQELNQIREKLTKQYDYYLIGLEGRRFFKREWQRAARLKLSKITG